MTQGIDQIPFRVPDVWSAKWFEDFIRDILKNVDVRNSVGFGIIVGGDSESTGILTIDEGNVDDGESLEIAGIAGSIRSRLAEIEINTADVKKQNVGLRQKIQEVEISQERVKLDNIALRKRIEELEMEVA